jgi:hypothetical protein
MLTLEDLKSRIETIPWDGCWIWMGATSRGYGFVFDGRKNRRAHRVAYEAMHGSIPEGLVIMHKCDHPECVNPTHLVAGTQQQNIADAAKKGRLFNLGKFSFGERKWSAKLTEDQVRAIRASREPSVDLAKKFGVHQKTVEDVRRKKTWKHVT